MIVNIVKPIKYLSLFHYLLHPCHHPDITTIPHVHSQIIVSVEDMKMSFLLDDK